MRWWGWGEDGHDPELSPAAEAMLSEELGADPSIRREHASLEGVELAAPQEGEPEADVRAVLAHDRSRVPPARGGA